MSPYALSAGKAQCGTYDQSNSPKLGCDRCNKVAGILAVFQNFVAKDNIDPIQAANIKNAIKNTIEVKKHLVRSSYSMLIRWQFLEDLQGCFYQYFFLL